MKENLKKIKDFIFTVSVLYSDIRVQNTVKYDATAGTQTPHMIQVYLGMQRYLKKKVPGGP